MTEEKRRALGQAMYGIGGLLLFVFGLFTLLYWVGFVSSETTGTLMMLLGLPAMVLMGIGVFLAPRKKK